MAHRAGNRALGPLVRTALVLASVGLVVTACSSGSVATSATATAPPGSSSGSSGGSGGTGSNPGTDGSGSGGSTSTTDPNSTSPGGGGKKENGGGGTKGTKGTGQKSSGGKGGSNATTTTDGIPPLKQQFAADVATFRSAMSSAQTALVRLPATVTPEQVGDKLLPLLEAANTYQSQMVNLPWSSSVKPLAQSLTQSVGQLTAVLEQVQRPGAFFSVRQLRTALTQAETSVRSASTAVHNALGTS
ncbi:MAG TPA: hypothetical protein VHW93_05665 [Acidimicrobiales bacterium]|nr:hypothetical protein [Acidimicrobiales bacterium]